MRRKKIGLVYNCDIRDNGTAFYCRRAFERMEDVETIRIRTPWKGEVPECDLYLSIDDGRDDIDWIPPRPSAFYAIDTHLGYEFREWKASRHDVTFCAQKDGAASMHLEGINAYWLPLGCDAEYHPEYTGQEKFWDFVFVGHLNNEQEGNSRVDYLDRLFKEFPDSWFAYGLFHQDAAKRFHNGKIGFNVSIKRDLNMRVFEVMSYGVPLLTNRNVLGMDELFEEGVHFQGYQGMDEMVERGRELLQDPELRDTMARKALEEVRACHTYHHRMRRIMEVMNE